MINRFKKLVRDDRDGLFKHALLVLLVTHSLSVANMLFHVVMGWSLPKAEYAVLLPMLNSIMILSTPMLALQNTLAHFSGRLVKEGRTGDIRLLFKSWLLRLLPFSVAILIGSILGRHFMASFFHIEKISMVVWTGMAMSMVFIIPLLTGCLQGLQCFSWMSFIANGWGLVRLLIVVVLAALGLATATSGMMAQACGFFFVILLGASVLFRHLRGFRPHACPQSGGDVYFLISLAGLFAYGLLMNGDMLLVKHFFQEVSQAGPYARASAIARMVIFLPQPVVAAMFPKVSGEGRASLDERHTLIRALLFSGGLTLAVVGGCLLLPQLALLVLFRDTAPDAETLRLVRLTTLAMAPLSPVFLLLNYELARHRFRAIVPVCTGALLFVGGVICIHNSLLSVLAWLVAGAFVALLPLIVMCLKGFDELRHS